MTTPAVSVQCQSWKSVPQPHSFEHTRCSVAAEVECRDIRDPSFVRFLCTPCADDQRFHPYDYALHGVINDMTRQREDRWPRVQGERVYRRMEN